MIPYTVFPRHTYIAPFIHRVGFSVAFGTAGYAISTGDVRNGSGIATGMLFLIVLAASWIHGTRIRTISMDNRIPSFESSKVAQSTPKSPRTHYGWRRSNLCGDLWDGVLRFPILICFYKAQSHFSGWM